jgi:hypothetical protein
MSPIDVSGRWEIPNSLPSEELEVAEQIQKFSARPDSPRRPLKEVLHGQYVTILLLVRQVAEILPRRQSRGRHWKHAPLGEIPAFEAYITRLIWREKLARGGNF